MKGGENESKPTPHSGDFATPTATFTPTITPTPTTMALPVTAAGWQGAQYSYESAQPHAVTSVERGAGEDSFVYDANGNMIVRLEGGVTWTQTFNSENRLSAISNGAEAWTFVYDGDGNRVKQINPDSTITLFLAGGSYTVVDASGGEPQVTRYYSIAGQRVAMENSDGLQYLLTDHLGSLSAVLDASGALLSQQRYLPFGSERPIGEGIAETDFGYTGQRDLAAVGLMDYNARWYSQTLGVFTQPDFVPNFTSPNGLNRFAYVASNPINRIDPTGNKYVCSQNSQEGCSTSGGNGGVDLKKPTCSSSYCAHSIQSNQQSGANTGNSSSTNTSGDDEKDRGQCVENPVECINRRTQSGSDYSVLNVTVPFVLGIFGPDIQIIRDRYKNWYFGFGFGFSMGRSVSLDAGWLLSSDTPTEKTLETFVLKHSTFIGGGVGVGGALTWGDPSLVRDPEVQDFALEAGLTVPGPSAGYVYGAWIYDEGDSTPWFFQDWFK